MYLTRLLVFAFAMTVMMALTGCGSGDSGGSAKVLTEAKSSAATTAVSSNPSSNPSPEALTVIAKAEAICRRLNEKLSAQTETVSSQADIAKVAPKRAAAQRAALVRLKALVPPSSLAQAYGQLLAIRQQLLDETLQLSADAVSHNIANEDSVLASSNAQARSLAQVARANGFSACATVG